MKKKIITVIGARPQIIKASAISRAIELTYSDQLEEIIVHTGQHYDANMSDVFFSELNLPLPNYHLNTGSKSHATQTADIMVKLEPILLKEKPDAILVYGDTNSTLAAALVSIKLSIPIIHVEAGLRSFNKSMPEEINRIITDHSSTFLFCPTETALNNLRNEGLIQTKNAVSISNIDHPFSMLCGDVMYDNAIHYSNITSIEKDIFQELDIEHGKYILLTVHRPANTDEAKRLEAILEACLSIIKKHNISIVFPLHPRTAKKMNELENTVLVREIKENSKFIITDPKSYLQMLCLEKHSKLIMTDSGGVQKEGYFFNKHVLIFRSETEWTEIVEAGCAILVDADYQLILEATNQFLNGPQQQFPLMFGNGKAAQIICETIIEKL